MSSIYRTSPAKRSKAGTGCGRSGGGGGGGSASWTLVGPAPEKGNPLWPCPRQGYPGFLLTKTRKNSNSQYAVCETRSLDDANTCQAFYNVNKKHWGANSDLARTCDWCDGDTGESSSMGVPSDGTDSSSKEWKNYLVVWTCCLGSRSDLKLKFGWKVPKDSPVIGKPCEAAARGDDIGDDIKISCTGKIKEADIILKKSGDYLLEDPPAFHFHCAKRHFDEELHKIVANKQECKVLGTSVEEEAKQACAYIPDDFGDGF